MSDQLPADIAEAVRRVVETQRAFILMDRHPSNWQAAKASVECSDALSALNAVILKHIGGGGWRPMSEAPHSGRLLGLVDDEVRVIAYGKTSHVPIYGWCLADQGAEEFDLCEPTSWMPLPSADLGRSALAEEGGGR